MSLRRRLDDADNEDHAGERAIDWRTAAPRWFLVWSLIASVGLNSFLGSVAYYLVADRLYRIEAGSSDAKWNLLVELSASQASDHKRVMQHEEQINGEDGIRDDLRELKAAVNRLNDRLARKGL